MSDGLGIAPHVYRSKHNHQNCRCIKLCEICHKPKPECEKLYGTDKIVGKLTDEQKGELARFINRESLEQGCDLPDYVIADFLASTYENLCAAMKSKDWSLHRGGLTYNIPTLNAFDAHYSSEGDYLTTPSGSECPLPPGRCNTCRL